MITPLKKTALHNLLNKPILFDANIFMKSIYKKYCADVIKRHGLPAALGEYIKASQDYL